jgi:GH15 family glucan-1,4-alpha-glucosidase
VRGVAGSERPLTSHGALHARSGLQILVLTRVAGANQSVGEYGLLADCNAAALVGQHGSIDWLCLPRFDSPSMFARILDPDAGHWSLRPLGRWRSRRRYIPGSLVLETTFEASEGRARVIDALAFERGQRGLQLGLSARTRCFGSSRE